jgi:PAS domain S-box-containing protein
MNADLKAIKLLIIEDNEGDFVLVSESIKEIIPSARVEWVADYKATKTLNAAGFDAILLDLSLPDKSGEELIREILNFASKIPVIALTGYVDRGFAVRSIGLGMSDYLVKDELHPDILYRSIIYSIERKKIFNDLEESQRRYKDLFHLSPLPMWVYDKETLAFLDVNDAAIASYGYSKAEFLGLCLEDIRPKEEIPQLEKSIEESKNQADLKHAGTFRHLKKSGEVILVEINSNPILFNGRPAKLILANDITLKKAYIETIEHQNTKLKDIAWMQSHVVRAPLARLLGLVNLLGLELKDLSEENKTLMDYITTSAEELDDVIKDINQKTHRIDKSGDAG